jgi:predicted metal-dependent enzyme (double-stranded beta helix superfamily)
MLDATTTPLEEQLLIELATHVARARRLWQPHVVHRADARTPVRLFATDRCEAWVIGWMPGQGVELHDHGAAAGALAVVEGTLVDLVAIDRRLRPRSLSSGTTIPLPPGTVHDVVAPGPGPATSIHLYSPPLTTMTFYAGPGGAALRSSSVTPEPAALSLAEVSRALHPSASLGA